MDPTITSVPPVLTLLRLCSWENVSITVLITSSSEEETVLVRFSTVNGPNHNQCTSCTNSAQVVFLGECLNNCPDNFFIRGGNCIGKILSLLTNPTITSVPPVLTQLRLCSWENVSIIVLITSLSEEETVLVRFYHC